MSLILHLVATDAAGRRVLGRSEFGSWEALHRGVVASVSDPWRLNVGWDEPIDRKFVIQRDREAGVPFWILVICEDGTWRLVIIESGVTWTPEDPPTPQFLAATLLQIRLQTQSEGRPALHLQALTKRPDAIIEQIQGPSLAVEALGAAQALNIFRTESAARAEVDEYGDRLTGRVSVMTVFGPAPDSWIWSLAVLDGGRMLGYRRGQLSARFEQSHLRQTPEELVEAVLAGDREVVMKLVDSGFREIYGEGPSDDAIARGGGDAGEPPGHPG